MNKELIIKALNRAITIYKSYSHQKPTLNFKLSLEDYFCNEDEEVKQLWQFIEKKTGKTSIEWSVIKIVEL